MPCVVCVEPRLPGPVLQDTKVTLPGWRCRLCAVCRTGVNHVPALANEPQSAGPCCSNAHTPVAAFAGAQRVLSMAQTGPAAGQQSRCPSDPMVASTLGHQHRRETRRWGRTKQAALARAVQRSWRGDRLPVSLRAHGGQGKAQGTGGIRILPHQFTPQEDGMCPKGLGASSPVCTLGNAGCPRPLAEVDSSALSRSGPSPQRVPRALPPLTTAWGPSPGSHAVTQLCPQPKRR